MFVSKHSSLSQSLFFTVFLFPIKLQNPSFNQLHSFLLVLPLTLSLLSRDWSLLRLSSSTFLYRLHSFFHHYSISLISAPPKPPPVHPSVYVVVLSDFFIIPSHLFLWCALRKSSNPSPLTPFTSLMIHYVFLYPLSISLHLHRYFLIHISIYIAYILFLSVHPYHICVDLLFFFLFLLILRCLSTLFSSIHLPSSHKGVDRWCDNQSGVISARSVWPPYLLLSGLLCFIHLAAPS